MQGAGSELAEVLDLSGGIQERVNQLPASALVLFVRD